MDQHSVAFTASTDFGPGLMEMKIGASLCAVGVGGTKTFDVFRYVCQ